MGEAAIKQGIPGVTGSWKRQEGLFSPEGLSREHGPADPLITDLGSPEPPPVCVLGCGSQEPAHGVTSRGSWVGRVWELSEPPLQLFCNS